ncbi:LacI family transcriptional regulator [Streptomyces sp. HP-A2021]|uniref:LacI family DNA-binding transcriptional regulator n=1 Tax=Streptomyces sp. HP-A2021 TaxID=2927875 RepID=UPI001FAF296C|nr:LacI family DNA-binding transcriptional regulator [Streptomyces sp. HP-A2021]UOB12695.1 LacI family transcriptional regulator [Streptomyces sp. HP-A2021]
MGAIGPPVAARTRLSDIAAQAGVSEATVSRALNGKAGVSAATRRSVLAAVDALGLATSRLKARTARLVAVITPELSNPGFPVFAQVIGQSLRRRGYASVLCAQTQGGRADDELVDVLVNRGVVGVIFVSGAHADTSADHDRYAKLLSRKVPFVSINGYGERIPAPFISTDDRAGMGMAVRHLTEMGHERIGLAVGQRCDVPVQRKIEGFAAALLDLLGRTEEQADEWIRQTLFTVEGGHAGADSLLDMGCTAIVCGSDQMALGAIRAVRRRGLSVPRDISVIGFDDSPLIALTDPPLTTIRQPVEAMATAAVDALVEEVTGGSVQLNEFVFQPELVVRGSTTTCRLSAGPEGRSCPTTPAW